MRGFMSDLHIAAKVFARAREARKQDAILQVQETKNLPIFEFDSWGATVEGSLFAGDSKMSQAVSAVFYDLPPSQRHSLCSAPDTPRGWLERARFWQETLEPALPSKMYHEVMIRLCSWYRHCIDLRKGKTV